MRNAARIACGSIACIAVVATSVAAQCPPSPQSGCKQPTVADKALLLLKNKGGDGNKLVFKWIKGEATMPADFGNPVDVTTYSFCLYAPTLQMTSVVPPSGDWEATKKGFKYTDKAASVAGIKSILLNSGDAGKAKIIVKGADAGLAVPTLPLVQPVIAQLSNSSGVCWEARFSDPPKKNDSGQFKDKGDGPISGPTPTNTVAGPVPTATLTKTPVAGTATATLASTPTRTNTSAGPQSTSTATHTPTPVPPTATRTATMGGGPVCGNGVLEPGEDCTSCAADCVVQPCTAVTGPPFETFKVSYSQPAGTVASLVQVRLGYKSNLVSLPGTGSGPTSRVHLIQSGTSRLVNDQGYDVLVTVQEQVVGGFLTPGDIFTIDFDRCQSQPLATPADFGCTVLQCSSSFGDVTGCTCTVSTP